MKTWLINAWVLKSATKKYSYHGMDRTCLISPDPKPFDEEEMTEEPFPIYEKILKIISINQCGEPLYGCHTYNNFDVLTCDHLQVHNDDDKHLYTKTDPLMGAGQVLYNKESFLDKLTHKVVAIQGIEVTMKGIVHQYSPGAHPTCGEDKGALYVACTYVLEGWFKYCTYPGFWKILKHEWTKCKPLFVDEHNWDMKTLEEDAKIGFRVDQCTEYDPEFWGLNRAMCYHNYCIVKYKKSEIQTLDIQDPEWDIGTTYALLYGKILGGGNGYFISGLQCQKFEWPGELMEKTSTGPVGGDDRNINKYFSGLIPDTKYKYRALLRNTGTQADTLFGVWKFFFTKA